MRRHRAERKYSKLLADRRMAHICFYLVEPHRDRNKRPEPYTPWDFMPFEYHEEQRQERGEQTVEEQLAILRTLAGKG